VIANCELWVDGSRYADGSDAGNTVDPVALAGLRVTWGRQNTVDQPPPATCTFSILDPTGGYTRFDSTIHLGSTVVVWSAVADGTRHIVFGGRVTDLTASFDDGLDGAVLAVVAVDMLADLANRFVGAEPWPAEELWKRARRILDAVLPGMVLNVPATPAALVVSKQDVDRQAAGVLLADLAVTGNAVLWVPVDPTGKPFVYYEDPGERASLTTFERDPNTGLWAPTTGGSTGLPVSACLLLRDPVDWHRTVTDLITRATVRWLEQTADGTTERSVTSVDTASESLYGARGLSVGTALTTSVDANARAGAVLAAHQPSDSWRVAGLEWDMLDAGPAEWALASALLDNQTRLGLAINLQDLPWWAPTEQRMAVYIEGGTYEFTDDRWVLSLDATPPTGVGATITFADIQPLDPKVRYVDVEPSVEYLDMIGVGPPGPPSYGGPPWSAATKTWSQLTGTWAGYTG
jgi:hypothetical protein